MPKRKSFLAWWDVVHFYFLFALLLPAYWLMCSYKERCIWDFKMYTLIVAVELAAFALWYRFMSNAPKESVTKFREMMNASENITPKLFSIYLKEKEGTENDQEIMQKNSAVLEELKKLWNETRNYYSVFAVACIVIHIIILARFLATHPDFDEMSLDGRDSKPTLIFTCYLFFLFVWLAQLFLRIYAFCKTDDLKMIYLCDLRHVIHCGKATKFSDKRKNAAPHAT